MCILFQMLFNKHKQLFSVFMKKMKQNPIRLREYINALSDNKSENNVPVVFFKN